MCAPLKESDLPFTVIADEVTDPHVNQEILSVCLRFVDLNAPQSPTIKECLINLVYLERANAPTIANKILESLSHPSVSLDPSKICGQAYDGAAVMASGKAAVQAEIKKVSPLAIYTHCFSHCLNLSIAASCKLQEVRNLIGLINESYLFLNMSTKRQRFFERTVKEYMPESSHSKLPGLCKTRWVERHTCLEVFYELYECFVTLLDAILAPDDHPALLDDDEDWKKDKETKVRSQGLKSLLCSFHTIATFIVTKNVLDEVKALSSKLQKRDQDIRDAHKMIDDVSESIKVARGNIDVTFSKWYEEILKLAENVGSPESIPRKTSLQKNRNNTPSDSPKEYYKRALAIPFLDTLLTQMKERFSSDQEYIHGLFGLIPAIIVNDEDPGSANLVHWTKTSLLQISP